MKKCLLLFMLALWLPTSAQPLKPGFDKAEYMEMLQVAASTIGPAFRNGNNAKPPQHHTLVYESAPTVLDNQWHLFISDHNTAAIHIRGTTLKAESWLENFFAAMVPAKGKVYLAEGDTFKYKLSDDGKAAVHAGWLIGMATISRTIMPKIDSCYKAGIHDFIIMGHSQGAGIAYLLRSYIHYQQQKGKLPKDIRIKTYCSAAPKPGNLYYAYDYENITRNGWGYTVLNTADWVPEVPLSLQTIDDYNEVNPFKNAAEMLSKQPFPKNIVLKLLYNRLSKPSYKLLRRYKKYLGEEAYKMMKKSLTGMQQPTFYNSSNYMRAGSPIILKGDGTYFNSFKGDDTNIFIHHMFEPYIYLLERYE